MLPPFIIDQIRRREEEEAQERERKRPVLDIPLPFPPQHTEGDEDTSDRGVVVIDLM